ncbi:hypothetical protein [Hymenobacter crusticola]|uniref:Lipocalin-like domain-containing protein n=1 Tax=Hymenobacter crusticola TaxID=1770526 RepID=A0A243WCH6_9BACT|nr:hypothetical protein [Hymenobacter crusticola]OUJ73248.1 hypothetical protein BXP70_15610 [Hymenobacter crusticola]
MKQYSSLLYAFFLLFAVVTAGCKKDKDTVAPKSTGLVGRWDLYQTSGGIAGTTTDVATGTSELEFMADSTMNVYSKSKVVDTRQYSVRRSTEPGDSPSAKLIFYIAQGVRYTPQYIELNNDQLTLKDNIADGFVYRYRRQ